MSVSVPITVTASTTTTKLSPTIRFDPAYIKTIPGILKIVQCVVSLIGFICVQTVAYAAYSSPGGWYGFVAMTAFWVTLLLIIGYLFHIIERTHFIPWVLVELIYSTVWTVFFFIAGCVAASRGGMDPAWGAASFFAFVAMLLYGYDAYERYMHWRNGGIAQGERTTNTTNAPSNAPSYPTY
ncbi:plasmolipin [Parasteatoda tepidariorum]|uniref:plasmolipin n=1 Tax=Parasteatoda tepidariorum TaxID=114398 RepID=UPI00077F9E55|nr:plasmolipin [Parasteatoda tepidariorum]